MWWIILVVFVSIGTYLLGYYHREVNEKIKDLHRLIESKVTKKELPEKSKVIDPLDPIEQAKQEMDQRFRDMNPDYFDSK